VEDLKMQEAHMMSISPRAQLGERVRLGLGVRIYDHVKVGDDCEIGDFVILGHPTQNAKWAGKTLQIPPGSVIRSHTVLYEGSRFTSSLETGHHVVIREGTEAGDNLRIGNYSDIEGDCTIGDYCRFHGYVHVGKGSRVGHFARLYSLVTLTNDPLPPSHVLQGVSVGDGAVLCVGVTVLPGADLGVGAFICSGSQAKGKIAAGSVVLENRPVFGIHRLRSLEHQIVHPWMNHFKDAYPESAWERLDKLKAEILVSAKAFERSSQPFIKRA
jgi:UDP-3-O-[3-hydroxymyristoyl] glucosamine N-acyltransferase